MWEICSIDYEDIDNMAVRIVKGIIPLPLNKGQFVAKSTGPQGTKVVGKSRIFRYHSEFGVDKGKHTESCLNELVAQILKAGWTPMGGTEGGDWYELRFRRSV